MNKTDLTIGVSPVLLRDLQAIIKSCEEDDFIISIDDAVNTAIHLYVQHVIMNFGNLTDEELLDMLKTWDRDYKESYR